MNMQRTIGAVVLSLVLLFSPLIVLAGGGPLFVGPEQHLQAVVDPIPSNVHFVADGLRIDGEMIVDGDDLQNGGYIEDYRSLRFASAGMTKVFLQCYDWNDGLFFEVFVVDENVYETQRACAKIHSIEFSSDGPIILSIGEGNKFGLEENMSEFKDTLIKLDVQFDGPQAEIRTIGYDLDIENQVFTPDVLPDGTHDYHVYYYKNR